MSRFGKILSLWRNRQSVRHALSSLASLYAGDGVADALGGLADDETAALVAWTREACASLAPQRAGLVLELGALFGLTTIELARSVPDGFRVVAVDNFCWNPLGLPPDRHEDFTRRILRPWIDSEKVVLVKADSEAFRAGFPAFAAGLGMDPSHGVALAFFDADHSYSAARDEIAWAKSVGVHAICGHDYGNPLFGVTRAVDEAFPAGVSVAGMCWRAVKGDRNRGDELDMQSAEREVESRVAC